MRVMMQTNDRAAAKLSITLAIVMIVSAAFVILNLIVDIVYSFIDPRVRTR